MSREATPPKGYELKTAEVVEEFDLMFTNHGSGFWMDAPVKFWGKNVTIFLAVCRLRVSQDDRL